MKELLEKVRALKADAERFQFMSKAFDGMKPSRCENFLEAMSVEGDVYAPLAVIIDKAIKEQK